MVCDTCDHCPEDENVENIEEDVVQRRVEKFADEFHKHGIGCGQEISKIAMIIHPNAIAIIPLYRSCIVVEQNEEQKEEGTAVIHGYADPHWLGGDIDIETLKSDRFHKVFYVHGLRDGPEIALEEQTKKVIID